MKKTLPLVASIISFVIYQLLFLTNSNSEENNIKYYTKDNGVLSIMYHRFNENKYPSTNIKMEIFQKHLKIIQELNYEFYNPKLLVNEFSKPKKEKKILITIDDGFKSFYNNAWPYLKKNKIPFILFVSTEPVGKNGYMTWDEIIEIDQSDFGYIGHHSHSHDYLIDKTNEEFIEDIEQASKIFKNKLGYIPDIFSYPFGEYSLFMKQYISKNFKLAFGQHSGIIDANKDKFELPRFPINEKYGELKRFKSIIQTLPFPYEKITPENRYIKGNENPPKVKIKFFKDLIDVKNITCYSNEGNIWRKSDIKFTNQNELEILLKEKFKSERGRINCSLWAEKNRWRWLGIQYVIAEY